MIVNTDNGATVDTQFVSVLPHVLLMKWVAKQNIANKIAQRTKTELENE